MQPQPATAAVQRNGNTARAAERKEPKGDGAFWLVELVLSLLFFWVN